jgi:hypothetical protein
MGIRQSIPCQERQSTAGARPELLLLQSVAEDYLKGLAAVTRRQCDME